MFSRSPRTHIFLGLPLVILLAVTGCSTAVVHNVPYRGTADSAYECALGAARDIGFQIESSDQRAGVFSAVKPEKSMLQPGNFQGSFSVDRQQKSVHLNIQGFGQLPLDENTIKKISSDFQAAFAKRCP